MLDDIRVSVSFSVLFCSCVLRSNVTADLRVWWFLTLVKKTCRRPRCDQLILVLLIRKNVPPAA